MMNMFREPLEFEVPVDPQRTWHLVVDNVAGASCRVQARSIVILAGTVS
jgi:pullulanase/glycogen debranching enzyme